MPPITVHDVVVDTRTSLQAIKVKGTAGEFLKIRVEVKGAIPMFTYVSKVGSATAVLIESTQFDHHPKQSYKWKHFGQGKSVNSPDVAAQGSPERCGLRFAFTASTEYLLDIEHCIDDGSVVQVVKDITYTSQVPTATYQEFLKITWN
jgi:hypothetical protein